MIATANQTRPYTADDLITLKASAVNALRASMRDERDHTINGIRQGYLADSACDGLAFGGEDPAELTFVASSIRCEYRVGVRVENDIRIIDYVATPIWSDRPWIARGWTFKVEQTFWKTGE